MCIRLLEPDGELNMLSQLSICLVPASSESSGIPSCDFQRKCMTSYVGETWQDCGIRVRPGDGGGKRPQKGRDTAPPVCHGRARSSSRAELREEVPLASDYSIIRRARQPQRPGPSQTNAKHLPDLAKIRSALGSVNWCQMSDDKKKIKRVRVGRLRTAGNRSVPKPLEGGSIANQN